MLVKDVMTSSVVTIESDKTLQEAVGKMLDERVGSVVVVDDDTPVGMITETDALRAVHTAGKPYDEIGVTEVSSRSPITIDPNSSVMEAVNTMNENGIKKLPVMEGLDLVGIITITDITQTVSELRKEAIRLSEEPTEED